MQTIAPLGWFEREICLSRRGICIEYSARLVECDFITVIIKFALVIIAVWSCSCLTVYSQHIRSLHTRVWSAVDNHILQVFQQHGVYACIYMHVGQNALTTQLYTGERAP